MYFLALKYMTAFYTKHYDYLSHAHKQANEINIYKLNSVTSQ